MKKTLLASTLLALIAGGPALAQDKELKSVGVTLGNLGNPFFVTMAKGAEQKAKEIGGDGVKVTVVSADYDLGKQVNQIDDFISAGVDVILLNAAHPEGIFPAVQRAKEAGIPVVGVDVAAEGADAVIQSNNVQAGELACQFIADKLGGKGNVVIINGPPVSAVVDRVNGCKAALEKHPDIKILSDSQDAKGSREGGLEVMTNLLTAFPDINAVFAINDPSAVGADLAAKQAQRTDLFITSVDGAPDAVNALKDESSLLLATAAQDPLQMATKGVETGYEIMKGNPPAEQTILIPVELITRDNVDSYKGWTAE
ncbi:MAG: ABC transporter substrate-binding protein [Pseudomonadota bacterium]|nr:ABC transporter substrate-binding protein [Pseudomonadota bacterium]